MIGLILRIILWVLLGLIVLVLLFLALPVFVEIAYSEKAKITVRYLFLKIPISGEEKKPEQPKVEKPDEKKPKKEKKKKKKGKKPAQAKPQKGEKNIVKDYISTVKERNGITGLLSLFCDLLKLLVSTFAGILRHIHFRKFDLFLLYAGGDAAQTANMYGKLCSVIYPTLEELFVLSPCKNHRISVNVSFLETKPVTQLDVTLWCSPLRLLLDVLLLGLRTLRRILKARKLPKEQRRQQKTEKIAQKRAENTTVRQIAADGKDTTV